MRTEYIKREDAIKSLTGWETDPTDEEITHTLNSIPAEEVEPVKYGKWEYIPNSEERWRCSECKTEYLIPVGCHPATDCGMLYCDHCGAKMDGDNV